MITSIAFIGLLLVYVTFIFLRGVHRERKSKKHKKSDEPKEGEDIED